jgi:hypothetical protein
MEGVLRIAGWDTHFENNRTRDMKQMSWVPFPNKHDGDGYTELVDHPDGAAHLGAWVAIVQVASKCEPRGTLLRSCGAPHCAQSISRITRLPAAIVAVAIGRLLDIKWLELEISQDQPGQAVASTCGESAAIPHLPAAIPQVSDYGREGNGIEGNRREGNGTEQNGTPCRSGEQLDSANGKTLSKVEIQKAISAVMAHYQTYHVKSKPGDKERNKIRDRFLEGYSVDDLRHAIDGCHVTPHNCGENESGTVYQTLELIMRTSGHVARFIENFHKPPQKPVSDPRGSYALLEQRRRDRANQQTAN